MQYATSRNGPVTADFPNWTYQRIEEKVGGVALFVNGAQGGMIEGDVAEDDRNNAARE